MHTPPWFILGAGAIGGLFAAALHRAGRDVTLLLRDAETLAQWRRGGGLALERDGAVEHIALPALTPDQAAGPVARVLVCTKAHHTAAALAAIGHALAPDAVLVLLQNGMGVREQLQPQWPQAAILHALTTEGAYRRGRFDIVHAGRGSTVIGAVEPERTALAARIAEELECELAPAPVADIGARLWQKLAVNSVINPLTALQRCRNGELLELPGIEGEVAVLCAELATVAAAAGETLQPDALAATVFAVMRATAANRSSMLQDLDHRRRTEIDFINGYVVREAQRLRLPCPAHAALLAAVRQREAKLGCT